MVLNLVSNAVKFTDAGEIVVGARVDEVDGNLQATIQVRDTGIGIDPGALPTLFDSFVQADSSTTRRFGGSGLGLTISRRLVEMMDGELSVTSAPGAGSTFSLTVALARGERPPPAALAVPRGSIRALLVDDVATNLKVLAHQLEAWGLGSVNAPDGPAALQILRDASAGDHPIDLVITDLQMPGMDGLTLAEEIAREFGMSPPVIILSSAGGRDSVRPYAENVVSAFLTKPARRSRLFDAIATAVDGRFGGVDPRGDFDMSRTQPPPPTGRSGHVLVADDNAVNLRLATLFLESAGFRVDGVGNGAEAVEAVARQRYDAVLLDCEMPVMDGYEAAATIRRAEAEGEHLPIVAVTASALPHDAERALASGMDAHVTKPVAREDLLDVLDRLLLAAAPPPPAASADDGPGPSDHTTSFDPIVLEHLLAIDGTGDVFRELSSLFARDAPITVRALADAAVAGDATGVRRAAHTLRGSAATLGSRAVADLAGRIEQAATAGALPPAEMVAELTAATDAAAQYLRHRAGAGDADPELLGR